MPPQPMTTERTYYKTNYQQNPHFNRPQPPEHPQEPRSLSYFDQPDTGRVLPTTVYSFANEKDPLFIPNFDHIPREPFGPPPELLEAAKRKHFGPPSAPLVLHSHEDGDFPHPHFVPPVAMTLTKAKSSSFLTGSSSGSGPDEFSNFESAFLRSNNQFAARSGFHETDRQRSNFDRKSHFDRQTNAGH